MKPDTSNAVTHSAKVLKLNNGLERVHGIKSRTIVGENIIAILSSGSTVSATILNLANPPNKRPVYNGE